MCELEIYNKNTEDSILGYLRYFLLSYKLR